MRNFRTMIASLSLVAVLSTFVASTAIAGDLTFKDLAKDHYAYAAVQNLVGKGVIDGTKEYFNTTANVNRAEVAKMVVLASGLQADPSKTSNFSDVSATAWDGKMKEYIDIAFAHGVVSGYGNTGKFGPNDPVTRAQLAKMVGNAFGLAAYDPAEATFPDLGTEQWIIDAVETAYHWSVVNGLKNGNFAPNVPIIRADAAVMINNALTPVERTAETPEAPACTDCELEVNLSDETPAGDNVPAGANVMVAGWDFEAGSDDVTVTGLTVTHGGVGGTDDVVGLVLKDEDGNRISKVKTSINSDDQTSFSMIGGGFVIPEGETKTIFLMITTDTTVASGIHNFAIKAETDVSTNGDVTGDFPAKGENFSFVDVPAGEVAIDDDGAPADVKVGETDAVVGKIKLEASDEDVEFTSLTLKENGDADFEDAVENVRLQYAGSDIAEGTMNDNYVTFVLDDPMLIEDGKIKKFTIVADIIGEAGSSLEFILDDNIDFVGVGQKYGYGVGVQNGLTTADVDDVLIGAGAVAITKVEPATTTQKDKTNVVFGTFKITVNAGKNLELEAFNGTMTTGTENVNDLLENIELYDVTNSTVFDLTVANGATTSATIYDRDLGIVLENGETYEFQVRADTQDVDDVNTDTFRLSISNIGDGTNTDGIELKETNDDEYVTDITPSALTFKTVSGEAAGVTLSMKSLADTEVVVGAAGVNVLEFELEETAEISDVMLKELTVEDAAGNLASSHVSQLKLVSVSGTTETTVKTKSGSQAASDMVTFDNLSVTVPKGGKVKFRVLADFVDDDTNDGDDFTLELYGLELEDSESDPVYVSQDTAPVDGTLADGVSSGRTVALHGTGILYVSVDNSNSATNRSKFVLAGATSDFVASYKLKAENEDVKLKDVTFTAAGMGAGNFDNLVSEVVLYDNDKTTEIGRKAVTGDTVTFNNLNYVVGQTTKNVYVKLVLNPYGKDELGVLDEGAVTLALAIDDEDGDVSAEGVSSGNDLENGANDDDDVDADNIDAGEVVYEGAEDGAVISDASNTFGVLATMITEVALVSSYSGNSLPSALTNGMNNVAIIKIVTAATSNDEEDGEAIKTYLTDLSLNITGSNGSDLAANVSMIGAGGLTLKRIGGADAAIDAVYTAGGEVEELTSADTITFDVDDFAGDGFATTDDELEPGTTTYFLVKADIAGLDGDTDGLGYIQVDLGDLNGAGNIQYTDSTDTAAAWDALRLSYTDVDGTKINEAN